MKKYPQLESKEWLEDQLYRKSRIQIARELGCHRSHVESRAKFYGITYIKPWVRATPPKTEIKYPKLQDKDWLISELETKSKLQIAEEVGCTYSAVTYMVAKYGILVGRSGNRRQSLTRGKNVSLGIQKAYPGGRVGNLSSNWRGGITKENHLLRSQKRTKNWSKEVLKRDDYTCHACGIRGGYLEADHIKSWAKYPLLRWDIPNGRTLCRPCHVLTFRGCPRK